MARQRTVNPTLPCGECKGQCCYNAPFTRREFKNVRKKYGVPNGATVTDLGLAILVTTDGDGRCAYLTAEGRCSVWKDRPNICQKYGEIPQMPCQYLYPLEAERLVDALLAKKGKP